jgi:hypothetical protein
MSGVKAQAIEQGAFHMTKRGYGLSLLLSNIPSMSDIPSQAKALIKDFPV